MYQVNLYYVNLTFSMCVTFYPGHLTSSGSQQLRHTPCAKGREACPKLGKGLLSLMHPSE